MPPDLLVSVMFIVADWGMKGHEPIIEGFKKRTGEPWMTQDAITGYGDMWILKEALESAKSADKVKVANDGIPATESPPGGQCGSRAKHAATPLMMTMRARNDVLSGSARCRSMCLSNNRNIPRNAKKTIRIWFAT